MKKALQVPAGLQPMSCQRGTAAAGDWAVMVWTFATASSQVESERQIWTGSADASHRQRTKGHAAVRRHLILSPVTTERFDEKT